MLRAISFLLLVCSCSNAAESLPATAKVVKLTAAPAAITLAKPFAYAQVIITATLADGTTTDVTRIARRGESSLPLDVSDTGVVRSKNRAAKGELIYTLGEARVAIPVTCVESPSDTPVSYIRDVQPLFGKLGCNAGTCHGAQAGKNGFKLSLRGYDPQYDHRALTDELEARRFNRAAPERSLMLMKASNSVPHVGGAVWAVGDPNYEIVRTWITQGVKFDGSTTRVASLELLPKNPTLQRIGEKQQFAVIATYPDGSKRDVTLETFIDSSNTEVATVDKGGLLTSVRRGEATMLARYEGAYAASTVVVMGDRSGFVWKPQPVHNYIDELVDAKLKQIKVPLSDVCTDEEFIRRVMIDLTGLPPSSDDVRKFVKSAKGSQIKRDELIDRLIGSEAFIDHWTNKWGDMLQINRKFLGDPGAKALRKWTRDAVAKNMPYDDMAYAILTGSGSNIANPPASYFKILRDPEAVMENTTQLFLAIRFNCNKCHDHPFERWTQDQYYQLSAYFAQVNRKEDPKYKGQKLGGTAVEQAVALAEIISDGKSGEVMHARTGLVAPPKFPFVHAEMPRPELSRRGQAAEWITSEKNPYFAKSYVNRIWSYLTGMGIIEPVDDIRAGNPPTNPELLDRLTANFIDSGFDTRKLIRTICQSRTYQLSVATNQWNRDDEINYSHALARRLPAEVLLDSVYAATGSQSKLPGLPVGARAAQLLDSNVELPGGFLELLGKPVRESVCECERSSSMMLGPVLAFVSGPVVGDAVQDAGSRLNQFTMKEKDDDKVVEEIYLAVLNRFPTAAERKTGVKALRAATGDHALLMADYEQRKARFTDYTKTLDDRQARWEAEQLSQKATEWTVLTPTVAKSKAGPTPALAKLSSKLAIQPDGSILASGSLEAVDTYTIEAEVTSAKPITGFRLEALADKSLPKMGPGRAVNGNFVLNDLKANFRPLDKPKAKPFALKLSNPEATYSQGGFEVAKAIDNNPATGWAISPKLGEDQSAIFSAKSAMTVNTFNASKGLLLTFIVDQRYGSGHTLGKFRFSYTTDAKPKLSAPVSKDLITLLSVPVAKRSAKQKEELRAKYLATDQEYARLKAETMAVPPSDPRVLGTQDLTWALLNNPAFLFNR